jgi:hypothetical protein
MGAAATGVAVMGAAAREQQPRDVSSHHKSTGVAATGAAVKGAPAMDKATGPAAKRTAATGAAARDLQQRVQQPQWEQPWKQ